MTAPAVKQTTVAASPDDKLNSNEKILTATEC